MREVVSIYAFYVDVFWLNCFLMNYAVLLLAGHALKQQGRKHWARSGLASLAGSVWSVAVLLLVQNYPFFQMMNILVFIPTMARIAFRWSGWREWVKRIILCCGITVLLGGITAALEGRGVLGRLPFAGAVVGILLGELLLRYLYGMVRRQRHLFSLEILMGEKREICTGLLDTGNRLRVPVSGEPVHIVSNAIIERLGLNASDAAGMVGYRTLGTADGMLFIYRVDAVQEAKTPKVDKKAGKKPQGSACHAVIAGADERMFEKKPYQVILNSDFFVDA